MHEFFVERQILGTSKALKSMGEPMMTIFLKGAHDGESYRTYVVRNHDNWDQWADVIALDGYDVLIGFESIKYMGKDKDIINADCEPHIINAQPKSRRKLTAKQQAVLDTLDSLKTKLEDLFE